MSNTTFTDRVKVFFSFLESHYGFSIDRVNASENRSQTDGEVRYQSDKMVVSVSSDNGYIMIKFSPVADGLKYYLTPIDVHEYLNTTAHEKELLLSTDIKDEQAARLLFNEKFLLNQHDWKGSRGTVADLERDLKNFSNWVMEHGQLCFGMSIPEWVTYYEYKIKRTRANYLRSGEDETSYASVQGPDGKRTLVKQSVFQEELDYIERLKKKYPVDQTF